MSKYTDRLGLFMWDLDDDDDLNSNFDLTKSLYNNWKLMDTAIGTNIDNIATNTTSIETNTSNIETLQTSVNTNTENISTLQTSVETNIEDIETLEEQVATNTTNIATNATSITAIEEKNTEQDESITALNTSVSTNTSSIEELQEENERLRDDIEAISVTAEAEGDVIHIDDASNARLADIAIYGNTDDDSNNVEDSVDIAISSKNLLDTSNWKDQTITDDDGNEMTVTKNDDGTFTFNGEYSSTSTKTIKFELPYIIPARIAQNCILSINLVSGTVDTLSNIRFGMSDNWTDDDDNNHNRWVSSAKTTYRELREADYYAFFIQLWSGGLVCDNAVISIQAEYGTTTSDYEQHQSQYFSLPVQSAMTADDYFDFDNMQEVHVDGDTLDMTDEQKEVAKEIINTAKTYSTDTNIYVVTDNNEVGADIQVRYIKDLATIIETLGGVADSFETEVDSLYSTLPTVSGTGETVTLENTIKAKLKSLIIGGNAYQEEGATFDNECEISTLQDEVSISISDGDEETQSYTFPIQEEMLYDDYIDLDNMQEVHTYNKIILSGQETYTWFPAQNGENTIYLQIDRTTGADDISETTDILCNYMSDVRTKGKVWNSANDEETIGMDTTIRFRINKSRLDGYDDDLSNSKVKALVCEYMASLYEAGNPMIIYYKASEEYSLDFTDEQKEALEELENVTSYADTTNIFSTDELSPIFTVEAYANTSTLISNLQSAVSSLTATEEE